MDITPLDEDVEAGELGHLGAHEEIARRLNFTGDPETLATKTYADAREAAAVDTILGRLPYRHRANVDGSWPAMPTWVNRTVDGSGNAVRPIDWYGPNKPTAGDGLLPRDLVFNTSGVVWS